ncbi:MAG: type I-E CRISPR-associated protein Cse1/CasA [Desulfobacterales bacterium]|nr:type I-E CRISPR-associated protein Cse1/CasA [Desulfobacterales bacterium]
MNLLSDSWMPVIRQDGTVVKSSPANITENLTPNPIVGVKVPRADLKGAIYQFLVGVLQTAFLPEDEDEWLKYWRTPPTPDSLREAFHSVGHAFEIDAENGPAFMQDFDLPEGIEKSISVLLIETPGANAESHNTDHFVKRGQIERISAYWAAMALFALQINSPAGGAGIRVSLRGGGPLTTMVLPPDDSKHHTLWHQLWLNVLTQEELEDLTGNMELSEESDIFPWMGNTRTSGKKGMETYPQHGHPLQMYWSMPRRIRLHWERGLQTVCGLSGEIADTQVRTFHTKKHGTNYAGAWIHPLTPYVIDPEKEPISIKAQPGGLGYRHWLGLVANDGKRHRSPALIVQIYLDSRQDLIDGDQDARLWVFGYDMDNMKARCWYESTMPVFHLPVDRIDDISHLVNQMIGAASDAVSSLRYSIKQAWFSRPKDAKGDLSFVDANFWQGTEMQFYNALKTITLHADSEKTVLDKWRSTIMATALETFDKFALSGEKRGGGMKRLVKARSELNNGLTNRNSIKALKAA